MSLPHSNDRHDNCKLLKRSLININNVTYMGFNLIQSSQIKAKIAIWHNNYLPIIVQQFRMIFSAVISIAEFGWHNPTSSKIPPGFRRCRLSRRACLTPQTSIMTWYPPPPVSALPIYSKMSVDMILCEQHRSTILTENTCIEHQNNVTLDKLCP